MVGEGERSPLPPSLHALDFQLRGRKATRAGEEGGEGPPAANRVSARANPEGDNAKERKGFLLPYSVLVCKAMCLFLVSK